MKSFFFFVQCFFSFVLSKWKLRPFYFRVHDYHENFSEDYNYTLEYYDEDKREKEIKKDRVLD